MSQQISLLKSVYWYEVYKTVVKISSSATFGGLAERSVGLAKHSVDLAKRGVDLY